MRYSRPLMALSALVAGLAVAGICSRAAVSAAEPGALSTDSDDPSRVRDSLITPLQEVEVPADLPSTEGGVLADFKVREGDEVKVGDVLVQIDDRQAKASRAAANARVLGAEKEAGNEISVRYAQAKNLVAQAAYEKGIDANVRAPGTYPDLELKKLKLEVVSSALEIQHAEYQLQVAAINVDVRKAELDLTELDVKRRVIKAPISGVVVKRHRQEGEWVRSGDPIVKIVKMDRLKIQGLVDGRRLSRADVKDRPIRVQVTLLGGQQATFTGKITYPSPLVEAKAQFPVEGEVENRQENGQWLLCPMMNAETTIDLKKR